MVKLYGIKNCDTIKKARRWLEEHTIEHVFHDFRADGLDADTLHSWIDELGWEALLNRRGTTWRKLPEEVKDSINEDIALKIMLENPAIIKRPVLDLGGERKVGFSETNYAQYFLGAALSPLLFLILASAIPILLKASSAEASCPTTP